MRVREDAAGNGGGSLWAEAIGQAADTTPPTISTLAISSSPPSGQNGHYRIGDAIAVTATFSEALVLTGTPTLKIKVGAVEKSADCALKGSTGDDAKKLVCSYTVAEGDADTDGVAVEAGKLAGTIKDGADNAATLTYTAVSDSSGHKVDGVKPTVTAGSTGYYSDAALSSALTGPQKSGAEIYTKVTFSEDMGHTASDTASARPEIFHRIGTTDTQYDILASGGTLASGDCKPNHASETDEYVCRYTVGGSDNDAFTVKAGTNSADKASNALAAAYTHATTLTLDTTGPGIEFPSGVTPQVGTASTITLTDGGTKVAKYAVVEVAGTETDATGCDDPSADSLTLTTVSPAASPKEVPYTPVTEGKKICVYAEDAVGNSDSELWTTAIAAQPVVTLELGSSTIQESGAGNATTVKATLPSAVSSATVVTLSMDPAGAVTFGAATLTIPASGTESPTVTVTAVDNDVDAADAEVSISGTVSGTTVAAPDAVTLTVTDDDASPEFAAGTVTARSVAENTAASTAIGAAFAASDADSGDTVSYALEGTDAALFAVGASDGMLKFKASPDYEAPGDDGMDNGYAVTVKASDPHGNAAELAVTVTVTNVDEAGSVTFGTATPAVGTAFTASVEDPDGSVSAVTWQWSRSDTQGGTYADISGATSASYTPVGGDAGKWLRASAGYTDGEGSGKSAQAEAANAVGRSPPERDGRAGGDVRPGQRRDLRHGGCAGGHGDVRRGDRGDGDAAADGQGGHGGPDGDVRAQGQHGRGREEAGVLVHDRRRRRGHRRGERGGEQAHAAVGRLDQGRLGRRRDADARGARPRRAGTRWTA